MKKSRHLGTALMLAIGVMNQSLAAVDPADLSIEPPLLIGPGPSMRSEMPLVVPSAPAPGPLAPPAGSLIEGVNFDDNAINTGGGLFIPPDPIGAVGPDHLVSIVNTSIEWHTKAGVLLNSQGIGRGASGTAVGSFFEPLSPVNALFDPKVIYDQHAGRFMVVALERQLITSGDPANTSRILLAVSDDSDPNGAWFFHAINSSINLGGLDHWADYPGFAVEEEAVYITNSMFTFGSGSFGGSLLWIVDKGLGSGGFYDGGTTGVAVYDAWTAVGQPGFATTTQPAHVFGAAGVPGAGNPGTFLVAYSGLSNGSQEFLGIIRVDDPLGATGGPQFSHQFVNVGDIDNTALPMPDAPQAGTTTLVETNDRRALHAVWRDNSLWTTATVVGLGVDAGQATAHWWQLDTSILGAISVTQQGDVGGEDIAAGTYTFMSSIAVDGSGNMGIGFAASAPTIFPSSAYTGRLSSDVPGTVQPSEILAAGQDFYVRTFGDPLVDRNRWGDYSGIAVDPADDMTFCAFNEYALTRGTLIGVEDGRWGTRWGCFTFVDTDSDGVFDNLDNCTLVANGPNTFPAGSPLIQRDTDGDGFGNICDADLNGDLIVNLDDFGVFRSQYLTAGPNADFNGDGTVNLDDFGIFRASYLSPPGPSGLNP